MGSQQEAPETAPLARRRGGMSDAPRRWRPKAMTASRLRREPGSHSCGARWTKSSVSNQSTSDAFSTSTSAGGGGAPRRARGAEEAIACLAGGHTTRADGHLSRTIRPALPGAPSATTNCSSSGPLTVSRRWARVARRSEPEAPRANIKRSECSSYAQLMPRPSRAGRLQEWMWHRRSGLRSEQ